MSSKEEQKVICIGAGPAGLTAAYLLSKKDYNCLVLEKDADYVGGISRTVCHKGFRVDIGGHRFFSKSAQVEALWDEILGDDFIKRPRKSRIFYQKKFFSYPLKPFEALFKLGLFETIRVIFSYLWIKCFPIKKVKSFEDWVSNQFGRRLFQIFFKTYTEKVWGMSCQKISSDWAAQRIKGLSVKSLLLDAFTFSKKKNKGDAIIKTLIDSFRYPRLGPGMMWEAAAKKITDLGNSIHLDAAVIKLQQGKDDLWQVTYLQNGQKHQTTATSLISSMPVRELIHALDASVPQNIIDAANALNYRDFLIVALVIDEIGNFDDNWIYIHDSSVKVGRIQNFRSWSADLIPEEKANCYGMEYFCFENDGLWQMSDEQLIQLAKKEVIQIGLVDESLIREGFVIRQAKAYPVYDENYKENVSIIRDYLERHFKGLHLVGRNGMHKYNNQDHAMMTAMLTAENILAANNQHDVWAVNEDALYHEQTSAKENSTVSERMVPKVLDS